MSSVNVENFPLEFFFFFLAAPWCVELPGHELKLRCSWGSHWILNPLCHKGTFLNSFLIGFLGHPTLGYWEHLEASGAWFLCSLCVQGPIDMFVVKTPLPYGWSTVCVVPWRGPLRIPYLHILLLGKRDEPIINIERNVQSSALSYNVFLAMPSPSPVFLADFCGSWEHMTPRARSICNRNSSHSRTHKTGCVWKNLKANTYATRYILHHRMWYRILPRLKACKAALPAVRRCCYSSPIHKWRTHGWKFLHKNGPWESFDEEDNDNRACVGRWPKPGWKTILEEWTSSVYSPEEAVLQLIIL